MDKSKFFYLRRECGVNINQLAEILGYSPRMIYRWENGEAIPRKAVVKLMLEMKDRKKNKLKGYSGFKFIDLFAGIGGLRKPFENLGGKCVYTSEYDSYAVQTYMANFKCDHKIDGDIRLVPVESIPNHDLLLAGFPCQPFSIAGVSKKNSLKRPTGFLCEAQGTLFFDVARIIEHHRPKCFLLENVKNLRSHDKGKTYKVIRNILEEDLGYQLHDIVIDARSWVPQHRERIFIVGFRESNGFTFDDFQLPSREQNPTLSSILHPDDGSDLCEVNSRFLDSKGNVLPKYILSDKLWNYLQEYAAKHKAKGNGFGFGLVTADDVTRTLSARYYKDGSEILVDRLPENPRRLTPRECSRLMGFDTLKGSDFVIPVSDTQAYKQFGNAVVPKVVEAVARHMAPWLTDCGSVGGEQNFDIETVDVD